MAELDLKTLTHVSDRTLRQQRVTLEVVSGPARGARHDFEGRVRIGSRRLADFVLDDPKVSGLHCEITVGDELRLRDLGSKNGTFFGPHRIYDAALAIGDELRVGESRVRVATLGEGDALSLHDAAGFQGILGRSPIMRALMAKVERLAQLDTTVLIEGETGTGKERVAEALHLGGPRQKGPLVIVDCGSLPASLIESELFGHERGAFTGAVARVAGAFERAQGGTIFLDEVGELPLDLQPKLLRVLESRTVRRLGSDKPFSVDVRVLAATNRDLAVEATHGRFREDLFYRLAVVRLSLPPLRDRMEDIPLLAYHLLEERGFDPIEHLGPALLAQLASHNWPGNVRELRNVLERSVSLQEAPVLGASPHANEVVASAAAPVDLAEPLRAGKQRVVEAFERSYITALLEATNGNISECARRAGMDRMSIHRLLQRHRAKSGGGT